MPTAGWDGTLWCGTVYGTVRYGQGRAGQGMVSFSLQAQLVQAVGYGAVQGARGGGGVAEVGHRAISSKPVW